MAMLNHFRFWLTSGVLLFLNAPFAAAAAQEGVTEHNRAIIEGLNITAGKGGLIDPENPPELGPAAIAGTLVGYLLAFIGVIFFALMVYGGFLWMMARGNEEQVKKAKELIQSAIIGLAIVALAYSVTRFVLTRVIGLVA